MGILLTALLLCVSEACTPGAIVAIRAAESEHPLPALHLQADSPGASRSWTTDQTHPFATSESLDEDDDDTDERDDLARIMLLGWSQTRLVPTDPDRNPWTSDAPPILGAGPLFLIYHRFVC